MPRWLEILLTLVLFTIAMTVLSWVVNATVPGGIDWLADRIGDVAVLIGLGGVILACAFYGWRGHRSAKGRAVGK